MKRYAELKRLAKLKADQDLAELADCLAAQDAILAELTALEALQAQRFEQLTPERSRLEANWQAWHSKRATTLRQQHALARAAELEARARAERTSGETHCLSLLAAKEKAQCLALRNKRKDDMLDDLQAFKTFTSGHKP